MFETDLHAHSLFSACGLHSIVEMLTAAKDRGLKAQAITDHGPFLGRRPSSTFFERLNNPVDGIEFFKGMECNVKDTEGNIDVVPKFMRWYDVILLGFHDFETKNAEPSYYSQIMEKAIRNNPCVDIIVHPNAPHFTLDYKMIAKAAAATGVAIELNNAKTLLGRSTEEQTIKLIEACIAAGCDVAVNTDAHALNEVGNTDIMESLLKKTGFPYEKIVNRTYDSVMEWIAQRKAIRAANY